jgi:hypothetical protein
VRGVRKEKRGDPLAAVEAARCEVARVRGWLSLGDHEKAEEALDRAMVALTHAEDGCPTWARPLIELAHAELDAVTGGA